MPWELSDLFHRGQLPAPHRHPRALGGPPGESNLGPGGGGGGRVCWDRPASRLSLLIPEEQSALCHPDHLPGHLLLALLTSVNSLELYLPPWLLPAGPPVCACAPLHTHSPIPRTSKWLHVSHGALPLQRPVMGTEAVA